MAAASAPAAATGHWKDSLALPAKDMRPQTQVRHLTAMPLCVYVHLGDIFNPLPARSVILDYAPHLSCLHFRGKMYWVGLALFDRPLQTASIQLLPPFLPVPHTATRP